MSSPPDNVLRFPVYDGAAQELYDRLYQAVWEYEGRVPRVTLVGVLALIQHEILFDMIDLPGET